MIIPIKCVTCGELLANKYNYYKEQVGKPKVKYFTLESMEKTTEGKILDKLKLTKVCCRRHMLTHVDI